MTSSNNDTNNIQTSKILLISEIFTQKENQKENLSIRVLGKLKEINNQLLLSILEFENYSIVLKLDLFESNLPSKLNCYYHIIGQLTKINIKEKEYINEKKEILKNEKINEHFVIIARVYRLVEEIDINLFKESLKLKRKYIH